jgi:TonB family protein
MMRYSLLSLLLLLCSSIYAQQFFDENWKKCSSRKAMYIVEKDESGENNHRVRIKTNNELQDGYAIYRTEDFSNGEYTLYNDSGDTVKHMFYKNSKPDGSYRTWKDGKSLFKKTDYRDGKEDGVCDIYFPNGQVSARYKMEEGNILESQFWNEDGSVLEHHHHANIKPTFLGLSENAFPIWVSERLEYPRECIDRNIHGEVVLDIRIGTNGKVKDVKVLRTPHKLMSEEAIRVVKLSPDWTPAFKHNQPCEVVFKMSIYFEFKNNKL